MQKMASALPSWRLGRMNLPKEAPLTQLLSGCCTPFAFSRLRALTFDLLINKPAPCAARFHHGSQKGEGKGPFP